MHLFTDLDLLNNQNLSQAFGALPNSPSDNFRVLNLFTSTSEANAYAICDGFGFIQENLDDSSTVNFIFKPEKPLFEGCVEIKYFIYRRLKKNSFLSTNGDVLADNPTINSDFLNRMWITKQIWNDEKQSQDPNYIPQVLTRKDLGLNEIGQPLINEETIVDTIFISNNFQKIKEGFSLGKFTANDYGFEIVRDTNYSFLRFKDIRHKDHIITVNSSFPNVESFPLKLQREKILNYLDFSALIGISFGKTKIQVKNSTGSTSELSGEQISEIVNKLENKNTIYLDVRNEYNYSLNFFNNYSSGNTAYIGIPNQVPYHDGNGWPILKLNNLTPDSNNNKQKLQLSFPNGDNANPICYLKHGILFNEYPNSSEKYYIPNSDIELSIPKLANNKLLPYYINVGYCRRYDIENLPNIPANPERYYKDNFLDNIFAINYNEYPEENGVVIYNSFSTEFYSGWTSLQGFDFIGKSAIAKDDIGTTYFSFFVNPVEINGSKSYSSSFYDLNLNSGKKKSNSFYLVLQDVLRYVTLASYDISTGTGNHKSFLIHSIVDNISDNIQSYSADNLMTCSITSDELNVINAFYDNFNIESPVFITLQNYSVNEDEDDFPFFEFTIGLQGINKTTGQIMVENTAIKLFSTNGRMFMSNDYASSLQLLIQ